MENLENIKQSSLVLFKSFIEGDITKKELVNSLYKLEIDLTDLDSVSEFEKDIWFKFTKHDTLATTIANIDIEFDNDFLTERFELALEDPKHFRAFFS